MARHVLKIYTVPLQGHISIMTMYSCISYKLQKDMYNVSYTTLCPRSLDPLYIVICYVKWVKTSWTHSSEPLFKYGQAFFIGTL